VYPTVDYGPTSAHVWMVWGILLAYVVGCLSLAAWVLMRRDRER